MKINKTLNTINELLDHKYDIKEDDLRVIDNEELNKLIGYLDNETAKPDVIQNKTDIRKIKLLIIKLLEPIIDKKDDEKERLQKECAAYKDTMLQREAVIQKAQKEFFVLLETLEKMESLSPFVSDNVSRSFPTKKPTELFYLLNEMRVIKNSI